MRMVEESKYERYQQVDCAIARVVPKPVIDDAVIADIGATGLPGDRTLGLLRGLIAHAPPRPDGGREYEVDWLAVRASGDAELRRMAPEAVNARLDDLHTLRIRCTFANPEEGEAEIFSYRLLLGGGIREAQPGDDASVARLRWTFSKFFARLLAEVGDGDQFMEWLQCQRRLGS